MKWYGDYLFDISEFVKKGKNIISVKVNSAELEDSLYCYVPNKNWISFQNNIEAGDFVEVEYEFSNDCDIVISNWDSNKGNYIFYNTLVTGIEDEIVDRSTKHLLMQIGPNPVNENLNISYTIMQDAKVTIQLFSTYGQLVYEHLFGLQTKGSYSTKASINSLEKGVYILKLRSGNCTLSNKIIIN